MLSRNWDLRRFLFSQSGLVALGLAAVVGYFLWAGHREHLIDALPYLLIGGCLLMHLFMHRAHNHDHDDHKK